VQRLIGALPAMWRYEEVASSPKAVAAGPALCVILSMSVEKAHPDVFNVLLQVLDDVASPTARAARWISPNTVLISPATVRQCSIAGSGRDPARRARWRSE